MTKMYKKLFSSILIALVLGSLSFSFPAVAEETTVGSEEDIDDAEGDIKKVEKRLKEEKEKKERYEADLNKTQGAINATQYEINKTESFISTTEKTISRNEKEIDSLNKRIEIQKEFLTRLMREMYYSSKEPLVGIVTSQKKFSQMLGNSDHISTLEEKINSIIGGIKDSKIKIQKDKDELEGNKKEQEQLLSMKESQQNALLSEKSEVQSKVNKKAASISKLNSELSKLKSSLSKLLGKSYDFDDILKAAKFASKATGVRKDYLLGMLVVESNLGRYTGGCTYKESRMNANRKKIFKQICKELDYNYKKKKVSCPPSGYSGTGGAMGVAQFMPDTWLGYKSQIASKTGHNPPDPWNLTDGVVGMAIKLARGGASKKSGECNASKLYLSGTTSSKYNWYCDRVQYWADNYESKF